MRLVKALDFGDRLAVAPFQDPQARARAGLDENQAGQAAWLLWPDGTRYRGAASLWAAFAVIWPVIGDLFLALYHLPVVRPLHDALYRWVAANRGRFPGGPPYLSTEEGDVTDER